MSWPENLWKSRTLQEKNHILAKTPSKIKIFQETQEIEQSSFLQEIQAKSIYCQKSQESSCSQQKPPEN